MIKRNKDHGNPSHWTATLIVAALGAAVFVFSGKASAEEQLPDTPTAEEQQAINQAKILHELDQDYRITSLEEMVYELQQLHADESKSEETN